MRRLPYALVVLPAAVLMLHGVGAPLGGSHVFRQAHVAANIDKFVEDGISLRASTYNENVPFSAFDFPLYQIGVAGVCRLVHVDALPAARVTSWLLFVAALVVLDRLLKQAGVHRWPRQAAVVLFAYAPLNLFYFQGPMVDDLAVLLALVSLQQYVAAERESRQPRVRGSVLLFGFLSTLIKPPVYLPVFVAMLWHRARSQGRRALVRADAVLLVVVIGLAAVSFKVYWMVVNGTTEALTAWERRHYFGTLAERFSPSAWSPVLSDLLSYTTNPAIAVLAAGGVLWWARRRRGPAAPLFVGLLLGCGVTLLVFFDRFPPHNYYQLPFVFPVAFFGAQGLEGLRVMARAGRRDRRRWRWAPVAALLLAILTTGLWSWTGFRELATSNRVVEVMRRRGEWIRAHTSPHDYVIYVFEGTTDDWNPARLYFAHREGYDLPSGETTPARVAEIADRVRHRVGGVLVFTVRPDVKRALSETGADVYASEGRRTLLRVDNTRSALVPPALEGTRESVSTCPPRRGAGMDQGGTVALFRRTGSSPSWGPRPPASAAAPPT